MLSICAVFSSRIKPIGEACVCLVICLAGAGGTGTAQSVSPPSTGQAADSVPQTLVSKTRRLYQEAKTFQAKMTLEQTGKNPDGTTFQYRSVQELRYAAPNRFYIKATTEVVQGKPSPRHVVIKTCDGQSVLTYDQTRNTYTKSAATATLSLMTILQRIMPRATPGFTLGTPLVIEGHQTVAVQTPNRAPTASLPGGPTTAASQSQTSMPPCYYIDSQNYKLLRVVSKAGTVSQEARLENQSINVALAPDALTFALPSGAAKLVAPQSIK